MAPVADTGNRLLVAIGIALPALVFAALLAWRLIANTYAPPPTHDLLFVNHSGSTTAAMPYTVNYQVRDGRLVAILQGTRHEVRSSQAVYRYRHEAGTVDRVEIDLPDAVDPDTPLELPVLGGLVLSPDARAPDGWTFVHGRSGSPGIFGFFFSNRRHRQFVLVRDGARLSLPLGDDPGRYYAPFFLGWVVAEDGS